MDSIDSAAFCNPDPYGDGGPDPDATRHEVARLLRTVADDLDQRHDDGALFDANGGNVGRYTLTVQHGR